MVDAATRRKACVIFTGTDPATAKGGIGVVMKGYFSAMRSAGISYDNIATYDPTSLSGKWIPWISAFPKLLHTIWKLRRQGLQPVVYCHAGAGLSMLREGCILLIARMAGAKTMLQIHAARVDSYLENMCARWLLKLALSPANIVCMLTPWWRARLQAAGIVKHLEVIPNPMPPDLEEVAKRAKSPSSEDSVITVLTMTRLIEGKGVDTVIRTMAGLPENIRLVVAGDGEKRKSLESMARDLNVDSRVRFTGWISGDEKTRLLEEADIFCLPSTNDAYSISMVEAMAYGVPVIAVRWAGVPDMVADERAGILVDSPDAEKIAAAIMRLADAGTRSRMSAMAKRWILEISSSENVGKKLELILGRLTK